MKTLDTTLMILMAEVSILLVVIAIALFCISRSRRNKEIDTIHQFIDQLEEQVASKNKPLDQLLTGVCGLDRDTVDNTLKQINGAERALLQNVIQLLLQRELSLLYEIDKNLSRLSEPYCLLLGNKVAGVDPAGQAGSTEKAAPTGKADANLAQVNEQLVRQLDTALKTIDEISAEYARVFSGNQTALELENSSKKMLQIFQMAEINIKQSMRRAEADT